MRASEGERLCQEAQVYYYDLLCQEEAAVPAVVRNHVSTCAACRDQMRRLSEALSEVQSPSSATGASRDETIETLAQQFQLLEERVSCSEAKPLLPELALASSRIRIPTPLTVHVDHCPQCAGDLAVIRELHLTADQLKRLGRFFETGRLPSSNRGREARGAGDGLVPAIPGSLSDADAGIACHNITTADLFDVVVPSGGTRCAQETTNERQKAILRHVRSCPACLEKVRTLRRTIDEIVVRADSEVVTVYHAENDAEAAFSKAEGEYPYSVSVEVLHRESQAARDAPATCTTSSSDLRGLRRSAKPLATLAAVVLVMIALATLLRMTAPTATATNIGDVDNTLAGAENIHIVVRHRQAGIVQEYWIAHRSNILVKRTVTATAESYVLYDLGHNRERTFTPQSGPGASERVEKIDLDWARSFMASCLRDLLKGISADAKLRPAEGQISSEADKSLDVYELPLSPRAANSPVRDRRLVYLYRATGLPQRMEFYRQVPGADPEDPTTTTIFTYPTEPEMDGVIQTLFPAP